MAHLKKQKPQGWTVYILRCVDGALYTGVTTDLRRRLAAHRTGRGSKAVRSRLPVKVVHKETAAGRSAALRREAAIKRLTRVAKLALIAEAKKQRRTLAKHASE